MPQKLRELYPDQYFHIIARSNNHLHLFKDAKDFKYFLNTVGYNFKLYHVKCFHYVLMNTHIHFIVKLPRYVEQVPEMLKIIFLKYYYYYKYRYGYDGNLWRRRYKAEIIDTDRYMLGCGLYIEHNPVKAGMVRKPEEYPWSSYGHWVGNKQDALLSEHPLAVVKNYKEIAHDYMDAYIDYIKLASISPGRPRKN